MIGLIISNIILLLLIGGVTYYVATTHNQLTKEIRDLRNYYGSSLNSVYGELSGDILETEYDLYEKMVEQERAYYSQLLKQSNDLNFAFSNTASGISSSVSQLQQSQTTLQEKLNQAASQQTALTQAIESQQEMLTQGLYSQQEMLSQAINQQQAAFQSQQEMLAQAIQEPVPAAQEMVYAEIPKQEMVVYPEQQIVTQEISQADDAVKRANLMAIAYYNALRDQVPNEVLQWDKINKHLYITGFLPGGVNNWLYNRTTVTVFTQIYLMSFNGKYKVSDVVNFITSYLTTNGPIYEGLGIFEYEKKINGGQTFQSLATTFGALPPDANFFPQQYSNGTIPTGDKYLFNIYTESPDARRMLDEAIKSVV